MCTCAIEAPCCFDRHVPLIRALYALCVNLYVRVHGHLKGLPSLLVATKADSSSPRVGGNCLQHGNQCWHSGLLHMCTYTGQDLELKLDGVGYVLLLI